MTPLKDRSVKLDHKIINNMPFIQFTLYECSECLDQTTLRPTEIYLLAELIRETMYDTGSTKNEQ